jgi:hypothetical protein
VLFRLNRCIVQGWHACTKVTILFRQEQPDSIHKGANAMSKGMDSKKQSKKEPARTMKEKRTAKKAKKEARGGMR